FESHQELIIGYHLKSTQFVISPWPLPGQKTAFHGTLYAGSAGQRLRKTGSNPVDAEHNCPKMRPIHSNSVKARGRTAQLDNTVSFGEGPLTGFVGR
ncbi:MAG: hypothetical protein ACT6U0_10090, partial [Shinella sp.]